MMDHFPKEIVEKKNDSELYVKLRNGSLMMFGGADNPDSWRGTNPISVVFDEYEDMKEEMWTTIIRPILTENKGTATFVGTPKGHNHFWKIFEYAKQNEGWEAFYLPVSKTKAIPDEELIEAKKEMPQALYEQEFECKFLDDASQFFRRITENTYSGDWNILEDKFYQIGADLGKHLDYTVLTPFDLHSFKAGPQERFNQIDWPLQKARIEAISLRHNRGKVMLDSTGLGDPIFDDLQNQGVNIEGFKFTEHSRTDLLNNLALLLEQDKIKIPNDEGLIAELRGFRYEMGERGKLKIVVQQGLHDDRVMSLALAVWKIPNTKMPHDSERRISEFQRDYQETKSRFHYQ